MNSPRPQPKSAQRPSGASGRSRAAYEYHGRSGSRRRRSLGASAASTARERSSVAAAGLPVAVGALELRRGVALLVLAARVAERALVEHEQATVLDHEALRVGVELVPVRDRVGAPAAELRLVARGLRDEARAVRLV